MSGLTTGVALWVVVAADNLWDIGWGIVARSGMGLAGSKTAEQVAAHTHKGIVDSGSAWLRDCCAGSVYRRDGQDEFEVQRIVTLRESRDLLSVLTDEAESILRHEHEGNLPLSPTSHPEALTS